MATASKPQKSALSRDRIVAAAVELLDTDGEDGLTFRALATRLSTGAGAIYWHVPNKDELLTAATDAVLAPVVAVGRPEDTPQAQIRAIALSLFDVMEAHPWVAPHLSRIHWQTTMLRIVELIGRQLRLLRVPPAAQFVAVTTLVSFILGIGSQNAVNARIAATSGALDRAGFLGAVGDQWAALDPGEYPFVHEIATHLAGHDDREQYLAGVDILLTGIGALGEPTRPGSAR